MKKTPFITMEKAKEIAAQIPTPFHVYDEAGIRRNARALKEAFAWNKGFKEYFAVKASALSINDLSTHFISSRKLLSSFSFANFSILG